MIVVTGGAGFIGSNLVHALIMRGERDLVVVDDLEDGRKFLNIVDCDIADYWDQGEFRSRLSSAGGLDGVRAVFHQGACSDTTEWNGRFVMDRNFEYSKLLFHACRGAGVPLIYASSAAVYGASSEFTEDPANERPVNVYGYSKLMFDRYVRRHAGAGGSQVAGLRYFNVYGPREDHKGRMASVALHFHRQVLDQGEVRLFEGSHGYAPGEQRRDFVHVDDVVAVNLWLLEHPDCSGIFNVGTGSSASFNAVAKAVIGWHGRGHVRYVPFPDDLRGHYQAFTEANLVALQGAGCRVTFRPVAEGVPQYLDHLRVASSQLANR